MVEAQIVVGIDDERHRHAGDEAAVLQPDLRPVMAFERLDLDAGDLDADAPGRGADLLAGMPRSISQALTSPPQTTGQPYLAAILSVSPRWSNAAWLTRIRSGVRARPVGPAPPGYRSGRDRSGGVAVPGDLVAGDAEEADLVSLPPRPF